MLLSWGDGGVQETVLGRAETIDFSLSKLEFTENPDHSLAVKTRRDNVSNQRGQITFVTQPTNSQRSGAARLLCRWLFPRVTNCMFKVVTEFVDEVVNFLEEIVTHGLAVEDFIFAVDFLKVRDCKVVCVKGQNQI